MRFSRWLRADLMRLIARQRCLCHGSAGGIRGRGRRMDQESQSEPVLSVFDASRIAGRPVDDDRLPPLADTSINLSPIGIQGRELTGDARFGFAAQFGRITLDAVAYRDMCGGYRLCGICGS